MKKATKIWLIAATAFIVVGVLIFIVALATANFDFTKLSTKEFETMTYEFNQDFDNISVNVETATVIFASADDGVCKVECVEERKVKHSVKIQDGTLTISAVDNRKWYDYIGITFKTPKVTVYLPKDVYTSLSVKTATGNIDVPDKFKLETLAITGTTSNIACYANVSKSIELKTTTGNITLGSAQTETVSLSATTGKVTVKGVACKNLTAKCSTGHIELKNVIAQEHIKVENTTGGVNFEACDAADITVKTSTGNVRGTLLSEKIFVTDTSTGRVRVPSSASGGRCEITTSTGNIEIEIENRSYEQ